MAWCTVCNQEVDDLEAHMAEAHPESTGGEEGDVSGGNADMGGEETT